jgi:hypothetical protein
VTRTLVPVLAALVQCQPATPPRALTPGPPPEARYASLEPAPVSTPEAGDHPSPECAPDPVSALYRALSEKRRHAIVSVRTRPVCLGFNFEALPKLGSRTHGVLWIQSAVSAWKLEFELSGATLAMKHASTQLPPQGVEVATCRDQLVLGGTAARPTLNGAPVFDDLASCSRALSRDLALNQAPVEPVTGWEIDCLPHAAAQLSRPEPNRQ